MGKCKLSLSGAGGQEPFWVVSQNRDAKLRAAERWVRPAFCERWRGPYRLVKAGFIPKWGIAFI